jgi:hypothetical protein
VREASCEVLQCSGRGAWHVGSEVLDGLEVDEVPKKEIVLKCTQQLVRPGARWRGVTWRSMFWVLSTKIRPWKWGTKGIVTWNVKFALHTGPTCDVHSVSSCARGSSFATFGGCELAQPPATGNGAAAAKQARRRAQMVSFSMAKVRG